MKNSLSVIALSCVVILLTGCLRGETKSLSEIFEASRTKFVAASKDSVSPDVNEALNDISTQLTQLTNSDTVSKETLSKVEESLSALLPLAGYTVRPSFTEVRNQFLEATGEDISASQAKMLATRAYNILNEELAQGRFQLNKSE
jgi:hypothetical protein